MDTIIYYTIQIILNASQTLWELAPYVLAGTILGEGLRFTKWAGLIAKGINKTPVVSTFLAIILGMVSPLCTYGTVPVVLQLYRAGTPIAPLLVFLTASSMMNPQLFIMTWGGIGMEFAAVRIGSIALFAALVGVIFYLMPEAWVVNKKIVKQNSPQSSESHCHQPEFSWRRCIRHIFKSLEFVSFYLVIGVILGSMVEVLVPGKVTQYFFSGGYLQSVLLVALISIPVYACGGGAIPFINTLIENGMSKGAAAAFFNVGSATRIPIIMALTAIIRPICLIAYILLLIGFSLIFGMVYH